MDSENRALIIVDVQPTFTEGGALGVDGGNAVAEHIADFVTEHSDEYEYIVTTQDWHISPGEHFSQNPDFVDTWPPHGVAGTAEAELHEAIASLPIDESVKKGEYQAAYSGFEGKNADGELLERLLREHDIDALDIVGLAESHCVKETALDGIKAGWPVRVFSDLTAPVSEELGIEARREMDEAGVDQLKSTEAFGFYEEDDDAPLPGDGYDDIDAEDDGDSPRFGRVDTWGDSDDSDQDASWDDDPFEDDESGAADFHDDELPKAPVAGAANVNNRDHYGDDADAELTSDGEDEELDTLRNQTQLSDDTAGIDFDEYGIEDIDDLDIDEDVDFSDEVDEADFDFSDIDFRP
ncbi:MAG: isochorismatase family protein [Actinomycetaceae bacterium]|nr:isochorismatase family protein [Arcanobacterium sp.]MDD7505590.1 isochorismatase family protein [Actinomycetaceae bacterium]